MHLCRIYNKCIQPSGSALMLYVLMVTHSLKSQPLHKEEVSGMVPLLKQFYWNYTRLRFLRMLYTCGDMLISPCTWCAQYLCQVSTAVVHACILRSYYSHKICIFVFPRISWGKNNSSNGAVPDPFSL